MPPVVRMPRPRAELPGQAAYGMIGQPKHTPGQATGSLDVNRAPRRPPGFVRGARRPARQRVVDRASGSDAVTILINIFAGDQAVPDHTHEVEEVLLVTAGE